MLRRFHGTPEDFLNSLSESDFFNILFLAFLRHSSVLHCVRSFALLESAVRSIAQTDQSVWKAWERVPTLPSCRTFRQFKFLRYSSALF